MRPSGRKPDQLREITFELNASPYAEGSCFVRFGHTSVLCTASIEDRIPPFLKGKGQGWVTAEYGMLPRATQTRNQREAARGKQGGRTVEIQRLIGRSLRSVVNLSTLGERQIVIDCDVITADGGTRTAAISGAWVALYQACDWLKKQRLVREHPMTEQVAAVSCGIYQGQVVLDLDYAEDANAQADTNFVFSGNGGIIEIQGTAEDSPFSPEQFDRLMALGRKGADAIFALQKKALGVADAENQ